MLVLPDSCFHDIDGFLSMADSVARSMSSKSAPAHRRLHIGEALGGECIHQDCDGRRFILGKEDRLGASGSLLMTMLVGNPASGDGPAGLGALHIFQEDQGVEICFQYTNHHLYHRNAFPGLRLSIFGWSVATWTRVKDGKLEREENYQPKKTSLRDAVGHALLAGGDVPAYYTAAPSPHLASFDDFDDFFEDDRDPDEPRGDSFGCLVSTWYGREIQGRECQDDEAWHFEGSDASLKDVSDGWHHVAIVGDDFSLLFYVDGKVAGLQWGKPAQGWSGEQSWTITGIGNTFEDDYPVHRAGAEPWGALADFRVFNRKLSAAEIDLIYSPVARKLRSEPPATV